MKIDISYKGGWYGCDILLADWFYPSTKRCSACGLTMDRDLNAALNLEQFFLKETTASSAESNACGEQCAMKRTIVSLVQPGRTRKDVLEPTAYPESKDDGGQEHAVKAVGCQRRLGSSAARPAR